MFEPVDTQLSKHRCGDVLLRGRDMRGSTEKYDLCPLFLSGKKRLS
jgi:hypothetical protein